MYKRFVLGVLFVYNFIGSVANAQSGNRVDFLTPTVASFMKYGDFTPSFYTGQAGVSIPLLQGKDNDFNIPVSLNYSSEGFMPGKPSGPVGQNWYLSVGGSITRKVNGTPDDNEGQDEGCPTCSSRVIKGFNVGVKTTPVNKSTAFNFLYGQIDPQVIWNMGYDYEPDEFTFNFMGYSGKFFISNDGTVRVISTDNIQVDLAALSPQRVQMIKVMPANSTIVLTTPNGYKYYFGGIPQNLEYSFPLTGTAGESASNQAIIHTWNLTKVTSPNGREANFTYVFHNPAITNTDPLPNESAYAPSANNSFILNQYVNTSLISNSITTGAQYGLSGSESSSMMNNQPSYSVTKTCYLEQISTGNFTINFTYSPKTNKFYNSVNIYNQYNLQLDNVSLKTKAGATIKQFNFGYAYIGTNPRHFLSSVQESGVPPYTFQYLNTFAFPPVDTHGIDHWGFWNGGNSTTSLLIPSVSWDASGNETITSSERNPSPSYSQAGLLQKITYPTGGYSIFEYEGNDYANRLERRSSSAFLPTIVPGAGVAGGARVKKISDYDGISLSNVREYKYVKNYINNSTSTVSSGFLLGYPRYGYYLSFGTPNQGQQLLQLKSSSFHTNYNTEENFINYSEVTEITNGNGYKVYKFSNYESNPDISDYNQKDLNPTLSSSANNLNLYKNFVGYKLGDRFRDRGKLLFTGIYDNSKKLIESEESFNDIFDSSTNAYSVAILAGSGSFAQSYKMYEDVPQVRRRLNSVAGANGKFVKTENLFSYDPTYRQVSQLSFTNSKGEQHQTVFKYPYDFSGTQPYTDMISKNIISPTIEKTVSINGTQTLKTRVDYGNFTGNYLPNEAKEQVGSNTAVTKALFNKYNINGSLIEQQQPAGVKTSYLWGYNLQYPIASVKNAAKDQIAYSSCEEQLDGDDDDNGTNIVFFNPNRFSNDSRTGHFSYILDDNPDNRIMTANKLPTGSYIVSFWTKGNGNVSFDYNYVPYNQIDLPPDGRGWEYHQKIIDMGTSNYLSIYGFEGSGPTTIDDIKIYPVGSQMTTYTYDPLIGVTSITDLKNMTTYYEYDIFQRLINIKDQNGDIIKHTDYHYQVQ